MLHENEISHNLSSFFYTFIEKKTTLHALPPEFIAGGQLDMIR